MAVTCGINDFEFEKLEQILGAIPEISFICLDVANGYTQQFVDIVRKTRTAYPQHTIIVSIFRQVTIFIFHTDYGFLCFIYLFS